MTALVAQGVAHRTSGVVTMVGQLDRDADDGVHTAWSDAVAAGARRVLLDFAAVDYINSTGIGVVVGLLSRARREDRRVVACGLSDHYRHVFDVTRLSELMTFHTTVADALGDVAEPA